jgi:hypothetical protein
VKVAVQSGEVELVLVHLPDCRCDLATPDPEATMIQLGCVRTYLVDGLAPVQPEGPEAQ